MPDETKWHLDRKVPITLIATIIGQTVLAVWWLASLSIRVDTLERSALASVPRFESVIRLETKVDGIYATLAEIKQLIRK